MIQLRSLETAFVLVSLCALAGIYLPVFGLEANRLASDVSGEIDAAGNWVKQVYYLATYGLALILIVARGWHGRVVRHLDPFLIALIVLALVSALWTTEPLVTLRRTVALAGTVLFGAYLGVRLTYRELRRLLLYCCSAILVGSLLFSGLLPDWGRDDDGNWMGLFTHKNSFGHFSALTFAVSLTGLFPLRKRSRTDAAFHASALALSLIGVALSGSATALAGTIAIACVLPVPKFLRQAPEISAVALIGTIAAIVGGTTLVAYNLASFAQVLGREETLTGRTGLWTYLLDLVWLKPYLGYGFGSFMFGPDSPGMLFRKQSGWFADHAHNGYLQLALDLGLIGLLLGIASIFRVLNTGIAVLRKREMEQPLFYVAFLALFLLGNVSEHLFINGNSLYLALFTAIGLQFSRAARQRLS